MMRKEIFKNLAKLPTPLEMREWDKISINFGIPEEILMENASREALLILKKFFYPLEDKTIWLFIGHGNNGGDAACLARHLHDSGAKVIALHIAPLDSFSGSALFNINLAIKDKVQFIQINPDEEKKLFNSFMDLPVPDILVDGLLGTGFSGPLRSGLYNLIYCINKYRDLSKTTVISLDIPSGLDGTTGLPSPLAIKADYTITFAAAKTGLVLPSAKKWTGIIISRTIGMPVTPDYPFSFCLLDGRGLLNSYNFPENSFKNKYGHTLVIGGIPQYSGAATLSALAALKSGAGLVTVFCPDESVPLIKNSIPEIMAIPAGPSWPEVLPQSLKYLLERATSLVIGPGMGRSVEAQKFLKKILHEEARPGTVIDADALVVMAKDIQFADYVTERDILTPHPGEAAALLDCTTNEIQTDRICAVKRLSEKYRAAIVLKGAGTLVLQKNYPCLLSPYDIPQLAISGSGDVLSGLLGALMAASRDDSAFSIAGEGVLKHSMAGLALAQKYPSRGVLASELAKELACLKKFISNLPLEELRLGYTPWPQ